MLYFLSVNYHSTELLHHLLQSVATLSFVEPYEVIIVNNSPNDDSVYILEQEFDHIRILNADNNLGFGGGCNLGLFYAHQRNPKSFVWLINPDATLVVGAAKYVKECFHSNPGISILGTRIRAGKADIWFAQGRFNRWTGSLKHRLSGACTAEHSPDQPATVLPSRWVSGCSMIFNLCQFNDCPEFDTNFFLDYEDAEICERYFRQGYEIRVTQAVLVDHAVSAITGRNRRAKFRHATFSKLYFLYKHASWFAIGLNLSYMLSCGLKLMISDKETGIGRIQGCADFVNWWQKSVTRQLPRVPFRPVTAFTQSQQTHK